MKPVLNLIPLKPGHRFANNFKNLEGMRFNRIVMGPLIGHTLYGSSKRKPVYDATCDCGNKFQVRGADVKANLIRSCGCFAKEQTVVFNKETKTKVAWCTFSSVWQSYKQGAKVRGLAFELDKNYFYALTQKKCCYCGTKPSQVRKPREAKKLSSYIYNGIDRLDSSVGYVRGNCVPCCGTCNMMKREMDFQFWISHMRKILKNVIG